MTDIQQSALLPYSAQAMFDLINDIESYPQFMEGCKAPASMDMQLVEGPFRDFSARWTFTPLQADACKVNLDMHFEFESGLLDIVLKKLFESTSRNLVSAVCKRADELYGAAK